jgi:transcriptional antiterminator NusG
MSDREVQSMLTGIAAPDPNKKKVKIKLDFEKGDKVRIREGAFSGMEGEVKAIPDVTDAASENTKVTVVVSIFGRPVDVELDYWQVDKA